MALRNRLIFGLPYQSSNASSALMFSGLKSVNGSSSHSNVSHRQLHNKPGHTNFMGLVSLKDLNDVKFVRYYSSNSNDNNSGDGSSNSTNYKSFTENDSNAEQHQTHGQALHTFGSSQKLEQSATRFDVQFNENPPVNDYQSDIAAEHVADVYQNSSSVSLSACMQSQVPQPYGGAPTHMNMPGGGKHREDKYVQGRLSDLSHIALGSDSSGRRKYSTIAVPPLIDEHGNPTYTQTSADKILRDPCPQGIQGEDCAAFKLWLSNCLDQGSSAECERLANEYIAGRKTLAQVFAEYEMEIVATAKLRSGSNTQVGADHIHMSSSPTDPSANTTGSSGQGGSASPPSSDDKNKNESGSSNRVARLKAAVRDYGSTVVAFHVGISLVSLGVCYTLVASNVDVISILAYMNIDLGKAQAAAGTASTFAVAYAFHKVFAPVRIGITLSCAPLIVKSLRARGILKTPPKV